MTTAGEATPGIAGVDPADLADRFGTPLYVYDLAAIDRQVADLRSALPDVVELAYALKANPALAVVTHLAEQGLGADVASGGELATALRAGVPPDRIVLTGPGKRDVELASAVRIGIRAITVESVGELQRLERIAADAGHRQPVLARAVTTSGATAGETASVPLVGADGTARFGMDPDDLVTAARLAWASPHLEWLGLHAFGASNVLDPEILLDHVAATGRAAARLGGAVGAAVQVVDAGGGLGIPYGPGDLTLDLARLGQGLRHILDGWARDPVMAGARLLLEPGRFLVGPAGTYLARTVDVKTVAGTTVATLDGGVHHLLRPALVGATHRLRPVGGAGDGTGGDVIPVTVGGPLCSGLDVLATNVLMARPQVGDLIAVDDVGAYGFTESMPFFLSHPIPAEVVARDGHAATIRPRVDPGSWLDSQSVPTLEPVRRLTP